MNTSPMQNSKIYGIGFYSVEYLSEIFQMALPKPLYLRGF